MATPRVIPPVLASQWKKAWAATLEGDTPDSDELSFAQVGELWGLKPGDQLRRRLATLLKAGKCSVRKLRVKIPYGNQDRRASCMFYRLKP